MMIPRQPLTIEDRVQRRDVDFTVYLEADQIDEFVQEIQGLAMTLHAEIISICVVERKREKQ